VCHEAAAAAAVIVEDERTGRIADFEVGEGAAVSGTDLPGHVAS
jgi:hypothetical protein